MIVASNQKFFNNVHKTDKCWLWTGYINPKGYGKFTAAGRKYYRAHRLSWELHGKGKIPNGMLVCHTCDVRHCVNPDHLFLGSPQDNVNDMLNKRRETRGSKASWAKLTPAQVKAIISDPRSGRIIAAEYGICQQNVSLIKRRINWRIIE